MVYMCDINDIQPNEIKRKGNSEKSQNASRTISGWSFPLFTEVFDICSVFFLAYHNLGDATRQIPV